MEQWRKYEDFIFETFTDFFPGFLVKKDDKIRGSLSGRLRQIDVSLRAQVEGVDLLYIVQAKDYTRPASIGIVDEFASVIREVGASKGFLVCAAGFASTIALYAKNLGIELFSVEDINSNTWKASVEIPVIFRNYEMPYRTEFNIITSEELARANQVDLTINVNEITWSLDSGKTFHGADETITSLLILTGRDLDEVTEEQHIEFKLAPATTMVKVAGCPCHINEASISLFMTRKTYLKMVVPDEYRHIKDHLSNTLLPTKFKASGRVDISDGTWTEIPSNDFPVTTSAILIHLELKPTPLRDR